MGPITATRLIATAELEQTLIAYWREIDLNGGRDAGAFFTADCHFRIGPAASQGRDSVEKYYADRLAKSRNERGVRCGRHSYLNLLVTFSADDAAVLEFLLVSYAGFGAAPILGSTAPMSISDAKLAFMRNASQRWCITDYRVQPLLVDPEQFATRA